MAGGRFVVSRLAIVARTAISAAFGVFVLGEILVASRAKRNLFDLISFFSQNHKLLFGAGRCFLWLIKTSVLLSHILDLTGR